MRRTEGGTCTEREGVHRYAQRWHREELREVQKGGDEANRGRDMHRKAERRVQRYRQTWHREELRGREMRRTERGTCTERVERRVQRYTQRWHREEMRQLQTGGEEATEEETCFYRERERMVHKGMIGVETCRIVEMPTWYSYSRTANEGRRV